MEVGTLSFTPISVLTDTKNRLHKPETHPRQQDASSCVSMTVNEEGRILPAVHGLFAVVGICPGVNFSTVLIKSSPVRQFDVAVRESPNRLLTAGRPMSLR